MKVRRLAADEYEQLKEIADGFCPDPQMSRAIVAQDGEQLVGRIFLVSPLHLEGPYVEESHRGGTLLKRLTDAAEQEAKSLGCRTLMAYGASTELESYLERLGYKRQPLTVWAKEI